MLFILFTDTAHITETNKKLQMLLSVTILINECDNFVSLNFMFFFFVTEFQTQAVVVWKEFDTKDRNYLDFNLEISLKQNANPETVDLWLRQMPKTDTKSKYSRAHDEL